MMCKTLFRMTWLAIVLSLPSDGARVLIVVENVNSHVSLFTRLGLELATLGHDVRVLAASSVRVPDSVRQLPPQGDGDADGATEVARGPNATFATMATLSGGRFNYTTFPVEDQSPYSTSLEFNNLLMEFVLARSSVERFVSNRKIIRALFQHYTSDNQKLFNNRDVTDELGRANFQFVIADSASTLLAVPLSLGVPYAAMSLGSLPSWLYRVPRLPSFSAAMSRPLTDRMTFGERLFNLVFELIGIATYDQRMELVPVASRGREVPPSTSLQRRISIDEAYRQASLLLFIEDPSVRFASPQMPNTIPVGDLMAGRPGTPLASDLESFVSSSTDGVVIVSFGSYFDNLSADVIAKLCDAFSRLAPGRRVVWKLKYADSCSEVEHVRTVSWLPQNDLLADQRVKLFITHGGLNSMMEAVYHAKPMLVFPIFFDQPTNAAAAVAKGYAIRMDLGDFTSESLLENIETMMSDRKYELSARHWSSILRDRRSTPAERVSDMIEHVIKYGDGHLRTGAFDLNVLQFWMFDLFAVICSYVLINIVIGCFIVRWVIHKCSKGRAASALGKQKSD